MKTLITVLAMVLLSLNLNAQDFEKEKEIQLNLDKFDKQSRAGLRLFAVGCFLGAVTVLGVEHMSDPANTLKGMYTGAVVVGAAGVWVYMDASRHLVKANRLRLSPASVSLTF